MPVYDGSSGLQKAQLKEVSLILLDIGLPDISGLEVLEKVRNFTDKPVIVISADFSLKNKVSAFTGRANIFHEKPIDFELLKAQVDSLMHNTQITKKLILQNNIEIDSRTNTVSKSGKVIKFTSKESALFNLLVKNNKNIVSRKTAINVIDPFGSVLSRPYLCHLQNNTLRTFLVNILFYRPECLFLHTHTLIPKIHHHFIICIAYGGFKAPTGIVLCLSFFHASPFMQKGQLQTTVCKLPSRCYNDCSFFLCFGTLFLCLCSASLVKAYIFLLCSIISADASSVTTFA